MALVAICAVIDIPLHAAVLLIRLRLCMAIRACEDRVVVRVGMAGRTDTVRAAMIHGEPGMVESCAQPVSANPGRVASCAGRWESRGDVIGIGGAEVIGLMARVAVRRRACEYATDVALVTGHVHMRPLQREGRVVVVERGVQPGLGCVADGAISWIAKAHMVRDASTNRCCVVVIRRVAAVASGGQRSSVVVRVARRAGNAGMRAGQGKRGVVVVEGGVQPSRSAVAKGAILREICGDVVGGTRYRRRVVVILRMAAVASGGQRSSVAVRVARRAGNGRMRTGKRERGCVVIERGVQPGLRRVAEGASLREARIDVIRDTRHVRRAVVIVGVATVASSRERSRVMVGVAGGTRHVDVRAG